MARSGRSSLTLAFGANDRDIYHAVRHISSDTLRSALGYSSFKRLQRDAVQGEMSLNAFCLSILRNHYRTNEHSDSEWLQRLRVETPIAIDPLQATFRGGRNEPLHGWFPWLEGYSPAFVEQVINNYCPTAKCVLDPFGGSGTTPLTVSRMAGQAYYAEINPVLQFLTASKIAALRLTDKERREIADKLASLANVLDDRMKESTPDIGLRHTYNVVFGKSNFFDPDVMVEILSCRTLIDSLDFTHSLVAKFLTVSVLSALIPSSLLIRRGDLRYKTKEELAVKRPAFRDEVRKTLLTISRDLMRITRIDQSPILLMENARKLDLIPKLHLDAIITSPPYLNGTNYFRNTKIELWFLRHLRERGDLARFRFGSMTAGINDVTVAKPIAEMPPSAKPVVAALEATAYDARIPRMVACFASEMHTMLQTFAGHVNRNGTIIIDIGDSSYAGVHVPTDKFISQSLDVAGFQLIEDTVLRRRYSRSQIKLTQKLLVFRPRSGNHMHYRIHKNHERRRKNKWETAWNTFKQTLPHQQGEFSKRNWGHPAHSLCSYQGKMKPSLAAHLVRTFTTPGTKMLDPFSGVGTIPFEAALFGVESWGFDISPPAVHVTEGKIGMSNVEECENTITQLNSYLKNNHVLSAEIESLQAIRFNGPLQSYFHKRTLDEILLARRYFRLNPPGNASQSLVFACLLHILHGNRPYALSRRSHPITPFAPTGPEEYRALMPRLRQKLERTLATPKPHQFVSGHSVFMDASKRWPSHIEELNAIITSPPFFESTRFHSGNWMRLWFAGWEASDFKQRPLKFVDVRQRQGFEIYRPIFRQCRERLKSDGVAVFHLGVSKKCDMAQELGKIAKTWFNVADIYTESVTHCENHGIRDKGAVVSHQYLVLQ